MRTLLSGLGLAAGMLAVSTSGAASGTRLLEADIAWDHGDYPAALRAYLELIDSADGDQFLEPIALQTGELFKTIELTTDGGAPRFSPDGRYFSYEIGRGLDRKTRLVRTEAPTSAVAELPGHGTSFSPDGRQIAYLKLVATPEMRRAEAAAGTVTGVDRTARLAELAVMTETAATIIVRDIDTGVERAIDVGSRRKNAVLLGNDNMLLFTGADAETIQLHLVTEGRPPRTLTSGARSVMLRQMNAAGRAALVSYGPQTAGGKTRPSEPQFSVIELPGGKVTTAAGLAPTFSANGREIAFVKRVADGNQLVVAAADLDSPVVVRSGRESLDQPAFSPDGSRLVYQVMTGHDWELHVIDRDGSDETRVTREVQHDVLPRFLSNDRLLGLIGEPRHRRSYLYDLSTAARRRLFHNNTVRTIAPEYDWAPSPDGTKILIVAERDGDTISPQRGVYLVDLTTRITRDELRARLERNLAAEEDLRARGREMFAPIAADVRRVLDGASVARIYRYEKALFDIGSKHITQPGNRLASAYLFDTYASFGYAPEYQWFEHEQALGGRTANVLATLKGTTNPELVYVVSSHYDSVAAGPGADDNSSGTAALLEAARLLARNPQPATIVFASFTGEESGLLGSREFVRRAVEQNVKVAGALNNDMLGWTNDFRLDDTIRYSNPGIRDLQHAAAIQFTNLITYDARYFRNTDAHAYYEAWGDIVAGIGSYPTLGNPHYHQPHDVLETVNHQLVTEVAKTTVASLMLLASSPSRLEGLRVDSYTDGTATLSWTPSPEKGVIAYIVAWGPPNDPLAQRQRVTEPRATINAGPGTLVSVKAINDRGLQGWDWARTVVAGGTP